MTDSEREMQGKRTEKEKGKKGSKKKKEGGNRCTHRSYTHTPPQLRGFFQKEIKSVAKPAAALYADVMKLNFWKRDGTLE